jgi:hypothetical protein
MSEHNREAIEYRQELGFVLGRERRRQQHHRTSESARKHHLERDVGTEAVTDG